MNLIMQYGAFHTIKEQLDEQDYELEEDVKKYEKAKDYIIYLHLHNFITDSEEERIFNRMHNRIKRNIKPKEEKI